MSWDMENLTRLSAGVLDILRQEQTQGKSPGQLTIESWDWPTGVALYGIWKTYEQTGNSETLEFLVEWYKRWLTYVPHRNVNSVGPMLTLACLYEHTHTEAYRSHLEDWAQWVMMEMPRTEFGGLQHITVWNKHYQQLWADTLFMTVLFLMKAGLALNRGDWVEEGKYQFLLHAKYLQDKATGLLTHGWTFDCRHSFAGAYWARGNAWFTAASVEALSMLNEEDAACRMIRAALSDQVLSLWKLQRENGLFTTLIDVENTYEETSATAGIAFGVLKGIRLGYLGEGYKEMGWKAANAVIQQIAPDGTVMGVSGGTGMGYSLSHYQQINQFPTAYGQGLTFLLLTELMIEAQGK